MPDIDVSQPTIDGPWFHSQLQQRRLSLRGLAKHMDIDPSAVSRMFSGQRKMQLEEAQQIAAFLRVAVADVLQHAGASIDLDGVPTQVVLAATIDENGIVQRLKEPRPLPASVIERAHSAINAQPQGSSVIAAQVRAIEGPLAMLDDCVVLFGHTDTIDQRAVGTLSICRSNDGEQFIAKIEHARKTGEARVISAAKKPRDVSLDTATPVIAIIP